MRKRQKIEVVSETKATYGIFATRASKKGTAGFWVNNEVSVVHPFGAVHVAGVLRQSILDIFATSVSTQEAGRRAAALMEYIKSDDFKNLVGDTIFRTLELYGLMKKGTQEPQEDVETAVRPLPADLRQLRRN